ncbi:hypothetical protein BLNAU_22157 [Blattamonas nauphoetae]|uniref:Uncharacterized protein n=1 Tax=Blattamonas nauphoetae TaxID=2049346 RepID=A0ABQ9WTY0_9EUKA|nr:hypothetical protein BLNAU_22157 [Blattamonas nauphoetae]
MNDFLKAIGPDCINPAAVFVDSMRVLLCSSCPSIFRDSLSFLRCFVYSCSSPNYLPLISSKLFPTILSTHRLQDLSVIDHPHIMADIILIVQSGVWLATNDSVGSFPTASKIVPQHVRDVVLREVLIPIEPSLVQLRRNRRLSSSINESRNTWLLFSYLLEAVAFHQPSLDHFRSSRIPFVFHSLLSEIALEDPCQYIFWLMAAKTDKWVTSGRDTARRGRMLLQTLEQEGLRDGVELELLHNDSAALGKLIRRFSSEILRFLEVNLGLSDRH